MINAWFRCRTDASAAARKEVTRYLFHLDCTRERSSSMLNTTPQRLEDMIHKPQTLGLATQVVNDTFQ